MSSFDLLSIGHSNVSADRFLAMLQNAGVSGVVDVRSAPSSHHFPWFAKKNLAAALARNDIAYAFMGDTLGGRPHEQSLYRAGIANYEAMAKQPVFHSGLELLIDAAAQSAVCMMCAEREPLDCHRCLLVARSLAARGLTIGHILHDGTIEPHATTERRLLALYGQGLDQTCDLFATGQHPRLAAAYRRRAHAVAFRRKVAMPAA